MVDPMKNVLYNQNSANGCATERCAFNGGKSVKKINLLSMKEHVHNHLLGILLCSSALFLSACGNDTVHVVEDSQPEQTVGTEQIEEAEEEIVAAQALSFEGGEAAESALYVEPVSGMSDDFLRGVDISSYLSEIESGVVYKDFEGNTLDEQGFFDLLAQSGVNCVRIRVWNDPADKNGNSYGGGHNDLDTAVTLGKFATKAGMQVLIDFHYSDFWADPSKQMAPKEWAHYAIDDKAQALYDFTSDSLNILLDAGVNVTMVQIGNETNNGMSGEKDWERISLLMKKGSEAIRTVAKEREKNIQIAVHFTNPESSSFQDYAKTLKEKEVDYDVFASSYYPFWHGTLENLTEQLSLIAKTYGKKVMVAETSYVYTFEKGDGNSDSVSADTTGITLDYDISIQGQSNVVRDVMQAVISVGDAGIGVFYWEPAWIPVQVYNDDAVVLAQNQAIWEKYGSGWASSFAGTYDAKDAGKYYGGSSWDNQAMFDFEGNPLESLNVYKYVFAGTTTPLTIVRVDDVTVESGIGQEIQMPEKIPALLNNDQTKDIPVVWNDEQLTEAAEGGSGVYEIDGTATGDDKEYTVKATLDIKKVNYVKNPGFEEVDMSMWKIDGDGVDREADNNKKSGTYSLKFWKEEEVAFEVQQEISGIPAGTYELGTFLQGGDAGSNPVFELYITVNGETLTAKTGVTSWQNWDNPIISDIEIPEGASVTVGVKVQAAAGAWGAWDDFTLYQMD